MVPGDVRGRRPAGRGRAPAARLPRARHLRHGVAQRHRARPPREHVPRGVLRRLRARAAGREHAGDPLRPAARPRARARARAVVEHTCRARLDAQGAVRLRLGLGAAAAHDRDLAPGRAAPRAGRRADARELLDAGDRPRHPGRGRRRRRALRGRRRADRAGRAARRERHGLGPRHRLPAARGPAAVVDARPRRAGAARPAGDALRRRRGGRRPRAARRHPHARARPVPGPRRAGHALLPLRAQRRRHLLPRRELDPGRLVRRRAGRRPLRAADRRRRRREHEHAARLGRRHLRARRLLRRVRPPRRARLAGLHVLVRDLPRAGARAGGRAGGARAGGAPRRASVARALVRQQREPVDPRHALPRARRRARAGRAVLRRDPPARGRRARPGHALLAGLAVRRQRPQRARGGRRAQLGGLARAGAPALRRPGAQRPDARDGGLHPLRRGRGALHLRVRRARRAGPRDAAALDPRRPALAPQPGDGPPHEGQPEEQDRHAARVGHGRAPATSTSSSTSR